MTETTEATEKAPKKRPGGLNAMLLADLKAMAGGIGIKGAGSMKKAQLVEAIKAVQSAHAAEVAQTGAASARAAEPTAPDQPARAASTRSRRRAAEPDQDQLPLDRTTAPSTTPSTTADTDSSASQAPTADGAARRTEGEPEGAPAPDEQAATTSKQDDERPAQEPKERAERPEQKPKQHDERPEQKPKQQDERPEQKPDQSHQGNQDDQGDGEGRAGRNRRRRGRDRNRAGQPDGQPGQAAASQGNQGQGHQGQGHQGQGNLNQGGKDQGAKDQGAKDQGGKDQGSRQGNRHEPDTTILEDDIVVPAAGILDVLDNYAFVRTSGYLAGPDDVYLSLSMVRKFGLRRGDAIAGQVRHPREGERREKFNPMVRIDSVNGQDPETAKVRADFVNLTPLSPSEPLRLETGPTDVVGRLVDLVAPLGKGQRGLVLSPPKAGKTTLLRSMAASISANNPECHLMVVLIDERPEEVTDFERSVKGEVIASTFDRAPADHVTVAELAIERAKRLVELGHDVVVLLDGLTRLGRAYNLALPSSGRVLSGVVDAAALHPTKRFFGAARNVENGGSLTVLATALVETGSATDQVFYEELRDTATMEVRLDARLAGRQVYPAVDVSTSGTRRAELFLGEQQVAIARRLRASLSVLDDQQALGQLLEQIRTTQGNIELLTQVQRTAPSGAAGQEN